MGPPNRDIMPIEAVVAGWLSSQRSEKRLTETNAACNCVHDQ